MAFLLLLAIWKVFLAGVAWIFGIPTDFVFYLDWLLIGLLFWIPKRWLIIKRPITLSAQTDINASITTVWNAIDLRERQDYLKRFYSKIRRVEGQPDSLDLVPETAVAERMERVSEWRVQVVERNAPEKISYYHSNSEDQGNLGVGGSVETYVLQALPDGGRRVFVTEVLEQISICLLVTLAVVSPCKDTLKSLKHVCEGTRDVFQRACCWRLGRQQRRTNPIKQRDRWNNSMCCSNGNRIWHRGIGIVDEPVIRPGSS